MKENELTPDESFKLIASIISEAKVKFEEDGVIYMMWGLLVAGAAFSQYLLLQNGYVDINYYPYFLMPLGGVFSWFYYSRKKKYSQNKSHLASIISTTWLTVGLNVLMLGFVLGGYLGESLTPIILILIGIAITVSGIILKYGLLTVAGIAMNICGFIGFSLAYEHQPLLLAIANLVCVFLPGLLLMIRHKKK